MKSIPARNPRSWLLFALAASLLLLVLDFLPGAAQSELLRVAIVLPGNSEKLTEAGEQNAAAPLFGDSSSTLTVDRLQTALVESDLDRRVTGHFSGQLLDGVILEVTLNELANLQAAIGSENVVVDQPVEADPLLAAEEWEAMVGPSSTAQVETVTEADPVDEGAANSTAANSAAADRTISGSVIVALPQTSITMIGAPTLWAMQDPLGNPVNGRGVKVAIIDSGIDYTHPDLGGCFGPGCRVVGGYDFVFEDLLPEDECGHGTKVAGVVAANGGMVGVAPGVELLSYRVMRPGDPGVCEGSIVDVLRAIDQAVVDEADVIHLGLSSSRWGPAELAVIERAEQAGVLVVAGAGNRGPRYETLRFPAIASSAFAVAMSNNSWSYMHSSSKGPSLDNPYAVKPDLTAPGVNITTTILWGGFAEQTGTAMASAHVAGAAALLRQIHPDWSPETLRAAMMNYAKRDVLPNVTLPHFFAEQGAGFLDLQSTIFAGVVGVPRGLGTLNSFSVATFRLRNVSKISLPLAFRVEVYHKMNSDKSVPYYTKMQRNMKVWLSDLPGALEPGAEDTFTLAIQPTGLNCGYYEGQISIIQNYIDYPWEIHVPFSYRVTTNCVPTTTSPPTPTPTNPYFHPTETEIWEYPPPFTNTPGTVIVTPTRTRTPTSTMTKTPTVTSTRTITPTRTNTVTVTPTITETPLGWPTATPIAWQYHYLPYITYRDRSVYPD